ncbi:MAG TPA: hypothetical protein VLH85_04135 [Levilinea sp.]|nr:hypothetical protein [Levilinea sp.]
MHSKPSVWYEARLTLSLTALLPVLWLPFFVLIRWLLARDTGYPVDLSEAMPAFEIILPLSAGLAAAHLMSIEQDAGFDELYRSYPQPAWRLPLLRTCAAFFITAAALLLGCTSYALAFGVFPLQTAITVALPPALFLIGLSLLVNHLSGSYWASAGAVMAYWFLELATGGQVTGMLFLFSGTWPQHNVSFSLNRWLLAVIGLLFLAVNAWVYARRTGWQVLWSGELADR